MNWGKRKRGNKIQKAAVNTKLKYNNHLELCFREVSFTSPLKVLQGVEHPISSWNFLKWIYKYYANNNVTRYNGWNRNEQDLYPRKRIMSIWRINLGSVKWFVSIRIEKVKGTFLAAGTNPEMSWTNQL